MRRFFAFVLTLAALCSCNAVQSLIHDGEVVARVGSEKLYRSDVDAVVPDFASPEDSVALAHQYINSWATQVLFMQVAADSLSAADADVSEELEAYRRSLMRYRYEQHYVRAHLDTLVTDEQIRAWYDTHASSFVLERPLLKVRFVDVMKDSPSRDVLRKALADDDASQMIQGDTVLRSAAIRYVDLSDSWTDAMVLAKEFGTDYLTMLGHQSGSYITFSPEGRDDEMIAYITDMVRYGVAPLESCTSRIRDYILSGRKRELLAGLEQELLQKALDNNNFVMYQ